LEKYNRIRKVFTAEPPKRFLQAISIIFLVWLICRTIESDKHTRDYSGIQSVLSSDAGGYYAFLPAFFIYDFKEPPDSLEINQSGFRYENGKMQSKYPVGLAIGEAPFFLVAHLVADVKDGYSRPYHIAVRLAAIFFAWLGLICCFLFLRKYTGVWIALFSCMLIFFGTNLSYYTLRTPGYSHAFSFFLIAIFVWLVNQKQYGKRHLLFLWPIFTLIVLVRPVDVIIIIPVLMWEGVSRDFFRRQWKTLYPNRKLLFISIVLSMLLVLPQAAYYASFGNGLYPGEDFSNWSLPRVDIVLFGTTSGLLLYTPLFLFYFVATTIGAIRKVEGARSVLVLVLLVLYIYGAWESPGLGCSFSHRAQIDFLIFWSYPLSLLLQQMVNDRKWLTFFLLFILLVATSAYTNFLSKNWWYCAYGEGNFDYNWFATEVKLYLSK
jgi:hypothetical protein